MDQDKTDLVMQFVLNGQPVWAECALKIWEKDTLMKDFKGADYDNYSNFFEVKSFDFKLALKEDDESGSPHGQPARQPSTASKAAASGQFARWRSASNSEFKKIKYPLEVDTFSFSRIIDGASPVFFQSCCTSQTFDSAVLVKRLSQGGTGPDGDVLPSVGYLRIDFTGVLITSIGWDDGEMIEEKCECHAKGMTIRYRQQDDSGTVTAAGETKAVWPNPNDDRTLNIRAGGRRG